MVCFQDEAILTIPASYRIPAWKYVLLPADSFRKRLSRKTNCAAFATVSALADCLDAALVREAGRASSNNPSPAPEPGVSGARRVRPIEA